MAVSVKWIGSPNYNTGRSKIDHIIIHWMVGTLAGTDAVFQQKGGVSAHYGIENKTVHQYVKLEHTAFHAGNGPMNYRSIGIEHSAAPGRPATKTTMETSAQLVAQLCKKYKIPCDRKHIRKHNEVSDLYTQCSGTIPIDALVKRANEILKGDNMLADRDAVAYIIRTQSGRDATKAELDKHSNKYKFDDLRKRVAKWGSAVAAQKRAKAGTLVPQKHLIGELRVGYKAPAPATTAKVDKAVVVDYISKNLK